MKEKELIEKLNNASLPQIKLKAHRENLRRALLNSNYFGKPNFMEVFKKSLVFGVPASLVLLILGAVFVFQPKTNEEKAIKIAENNQQIKEYIEQNHMMMGEVKIKDGTAYILLTPPYIEDFEFKEEKTIQIKFQEEKEDESDGIEGAVVEIELNKKQVKQISPIKGDDVSPLAEKDIESAKQIIDKEEIMKDIFPKEWEIDEIKASLPRKMKLTEEDDKIKVVPDSDEEEKRANIHYSSDGKKWIIKVNLLKERVEEIRYSLDKKNEKGRH
jgi:hypothetical protein